MPVFLLPLPAFPEISGEGVRRGLSLSFTQVIPSLYPFILLTTLFKALSHDSRYARRLSLFAGFLSGYPLGAKVVAEQYDGGLFTPRAMLVICNNPSPAYMLSFVGLESLGRPVYGLQMYAAILAGNLLTGILISCFSSRKQSRPAPTVLRAQSAPSKMSLTDRVFQDTFETIGPDLRIYSRRRSRRCLYPENSHIPAVNPGCSYRLPGNDRRRGISRTDGPAACTEAPADYRNHFFRRSLCFCPDPEYDRPQPFIHKKIHDR